MAKIIYPKYYQGPVNAGEARLFSYLKAQLPDEGYYIFPNLEITHRDTRSGQVQYLEYDCVLITPHALYNIEIKDYAGNLEGDDDVWIHKGREMRNPHKTLKFKTGVLVSKLKDANYEFRRAWIQNVVVLTHAHQNKNGLFQEHAKATFLLDDALTKHLQDPYGLQKLKNNIIDLVPAIRDFIQQNIYSKKNKPRTEVRGYEVVKVLAQDKNYTEYLAKPKGVTSAQQKRIREYALSLPDISDKEARDLELKVQNQFAALHKIKQNPFILNVQFERDEENHLFYEITDYLEESTLSVELKRRTFTVEEKRNILKNILSALKAAHEAQVYHRDLNPNNIFLTGNYAYLGNFGKAYFIDHHQQGFTVMTTLTNDTTTAYHAPELLTKDASRASDIYSLGVLTYELFMSKLPISSPFELDKLGGKLPEDRYNLSEANLAWLKEFANQSIRTNPEDRWDNLEELEEFLEENAWGNNKESVVVSSHSKPNRQTDLQIGEVVGDYTIYEVLGTGGYSKVYKVKHHLRGEKEYALKLFNESVSADAVIDEYNALKELKHPHIVGFEWNGRINGQFFTLMEYLKGEDLSNYTQGSKKMPIHLIYQVGKDILQALASMQNRDPMILHRDIKPKNILWDTQKVQRFVLIDFNVASVSEENYTHVGTHPYLAPDLWQSTNKVNWDSSADPFALGITMYELVCQTHPWEQGFSALSIEPQHPKIHYPQLSDKFADFLFKAIQPKKEYRFDSAEAMLKALLQINEDEPLLETNITYDTTETEEEIPENEDIVAYINSLYSQSKSGNAGTRASKQTHYFNTQTYIKTKLDTKLIPAILDGMYRLVIITGNAGDGKTAFIRNLEEQTQVYQKLPHQNGASFQIQGIPYESNYDGSQDQEEQANDQVLSDFFTPFKDTLDDLRQAKAGRIIAINEGRLVEFLKKSIDFQVLADTIEQYFYEENDVKLPEGMLIINLNLRSIIAEDANYPSLFKQQLKALTQKKLWAKCDTCILRDKCFIHYNVSTFNDSAAGDEVMNRFEWILKTATLTRSFHITMRDMRSMIAYLLTKDYHCTEIEALWYKYENNLLEWWQFYYFNITNPLQKNSGNQDRLIMLLRQIDIAQRPVPQSDRDVYFSDLLEDDYLEFSERLGGLVPFFNVNKEIYDPHQQDIHTREHILQLHKTIIRHRYFEAKQDQFFRLPYHSLIDFYKILKEDLQKSELAIRQSLSTAISFSENCTNREIAQKYLVLSSAFVKDPYGRTYRIFPLDEFELLIPHKKNLTAYIEYQADHLIFQSKNEKHIHLRISLDLFEMLYFIEKGFNPSLNELRGQFIELQIFKNQLENRVYNEALITKDDVNFYKIEKTKTDSLKISKVNI